jgi:hypothetical protein
VGLWELGDLEAQVVLRLLEGSAPSATGNPPRMSYLVGAGALLRVGTGAMDDANVFLDMPAGDGQNDLEARVFADLRFRRGGVWSEVRYGIQQSRTISRRVGPPDVVLIPAINLADVEWTPGSYLAGELAPRFHFTDQLSLSGSYRFFHKGKDSYTRRAAPPTVPETSPLPYPIVFADVEALASGTEETVHQVGAGLFYSTWAPALQGRSSLPLEAQLGVKWSLAGSGFNAPSGVQANAALRLFFHLWGD